MSNSYSVDRLSEMYLNELFKYECNKKGSNINGDEYTLRSWCGRLFEYKDGRYVEIRIDETKSLISMYLQEQIKRDRSFSGIRISGHLVSNILLCLQGNPNVYIPESVTMNSWLTQGKLALSNGNNHEDIQTLSFENGLLNIDSKTLETELVSHSPDYFTLNKLPYDYNAKATCPKWNHFLDDIMNGDEDCVELLQQWAGYVLTNDLQQQKFLLCVGNGANGKGVFTKVIEHMVGQENCSHVNLARFGNEFALNSTLGKMLNASTEGSEMIDGLAEVMLKAFTAGDAMSFNRKHKSYIDAVPTAKVMISTNELPRFKDRSDGLWRRMLFVSFDKTYAEQEQNKNLAEQLIGELPGIFNWALEGLKSLRQNGRFIEPTRSKEALGEYKRSGNPAKLFLDENYVEQYNSEGVCFQDLYKKYRVWSEENGFNPMNSSNLGRELHRVFPNIDRIRKRIDEKRVHFYVGLVPVDSFKDDDRPLIAEDSVI